MVWLGFYRLAAGAGLLISAGLCQFSNLKAACLAEYRLPLTYFMQYWKSGSPPQVTATHGVLSLPRRFGQISQPKVTIRPGWAADRRGGHDDGARCSGRNIGTMISTGYWIGRDITIAQARKGRVCAQGRVWNF